MLQQTGHINPFGENFRFFKFYPSDSHKKVVHRITRGLEGNCGLALLTGEIGIGKTSVCRYITQSSGEQFVFAESGNPFLKPAEQLYNFCKQFGIDTTGRSSISDLTEALTEFFKQKADEGIKPVILIDECHLLAAEHFSLLLVLYNLRVGAVPLVQIILVGQVEIMDRLKEPGLEALNQRIGVRCELAPMNKEEMKKYIQFKLRNADFHDLDVFTTPTLNRLWQVTGGLPRLINHACSHALDSIAFTGESTVSPKLIDQVAADPMYQGLFTIRTKKEESRYRLKIAAAVAAVCLVGTAGYFALNMNEPVATVPPVVVAEAPVAAQIAPEAIASSVVSENTLVAVPANVATPSVSVVQQSAPAPKQAVQPVAQSGQIAQQAATQASQPTQFAQQNVLMQSAPSADTPSAAVATGMTGADTVVVPQNQPATQPAPVVVASMEDTPKVAASAPKVVAKPKQNTAKKVAKAVKKSAKDEMAALLADALDDAMHPALASLQISAVAWSDTQSERMAVLNNRIFHEGDNVGAFVLEKIGRDYLIFTVDGTRYKKKWT